MRPLIGALALFSVLGILPGCGSSNSGPTTGPAGENRSAEQKQNEDLMQKALQKARTKGAR